MLNARSHTIEFTEFVQEARFTPSGEYLIVNADDFNVWKFPIDQVDQISDGTQGEIILTAQSLTYDTAISPDSEWVAVVELDTENAQKNRGTLVSVDGSEPGFGRPLTRGADGDLQQPELLYRPYRIGAAGQSVACGFRDHALSDLIGFTYASWSADRAADDFVDRLVTAGRRYASRTDGAEATIFVILDGENAWEHYEGQGHPFLRALYGRLAAHPEIRTVTMSEACAAPTETLRSIAAG